VATYLASLTIGKRTAIRDHGSLPSVWVVVNTKKPSHFTANPHPLHCGLSDLNRQINTPTFIDSTILADKSTAGTMYSDKIAKAIYRDLRKIAVKQTNETLWDPDCWD
jgi:hypothetical protein